jgi:cobalamin biosynthesis Mg chelatase CobN
MLRESFEKIIDTARTCCESTARRDEPAKKNKVRRGVAEVSAHAKPKPEATESKPRARLREAGA